MTYLNRTQKFTVGAAMAQCCKRLGLKVEFFDFALVNDEPQPRRAYVTATPAQMQLAVALDA